MVKEKISKIIKDNNLIYPEDILDCTIITINDFYENKNIKEKQYEELINLCCNYFKKSKEEILARIVWLKSLNLEHVWGLKNNHKIIMEIMDSLNLVLESEKIDHYYTSGILSYLLVDKPLERYHHDIDIFINYYDLPKLIQAAEKHNFTFKRILGDRENGTQRRVLKLYYKDYYDIPITLFMFVRNLDGSITQRDYYFQNNVMLLEEIYNSCQTVELSFDEAKHYHNNIPYKTITLEALYLSKNGHRKKDIYDCRIMAEKIDWEKLEQLEKDMALSMRYYTKVVNNPEEIDFIKDFTYQEKLILK